MLGTLDLSGMAELKPGYSKYHLNVTCQEDGEEYIRFSTTEYITFVSFLTDGEEQIYPDDYFSFVRQNEFYLEVLI